MRWCIAALVLFAIVGVVLSRKKVSAAERAFDKNEGIDWARSDEDGNDSGAEKAGKTTAKSVQYIIATESVTPETEAAAEKRAEDKDEGDAIIDLLSRVVDISNLTKHIEEEYLSSEEDALNRTVLWIDASYKAEDFNLNVSALPECQAWQKFWSINTTRKDGKELNTTTEDQLSTDDLDLKETELVDKKKRMKQLGLNEELLKAFKAVGLLYKEICGDHGRVLWFRDTTDAKKIGITESSLICEPFKEELTPDAETLVALSRTLNELVHNSTLGITSVPEAASAVEHSVAVNDVVITTAEHGLPEAATTTDRYVDGEHRTISNEHSGTFILTATPRPYADQPMRTVVVEGAEEDEVPKGTAFLLMEQDADQIAQVAKMGGWKTVPSQPLAGPVYPFAPSSPRDHEDRGQITDRDPKEQNHRNRLVVSRVKRSLPSFEEGIEKKEDSEDDDDEWLFNVNPTTEKADENSTEDGEDVSGNATEFKWVTIEQTEEDHPVLLISSQEAIEGLRLRVPEDALQRFEKIGLYLPGICADYVPKAVDEFNSSSFEGVEIEGPIGVNISALEAAGVNLTALAEKLRNDTEVDDILSRTNASIKTLGGSFILPVLNKNQYDPFSAPIVFQGSAVVVRFGIYIESMSNFQTSTMDYDMDIYLMMAWRDARLVNPYNKPILVKEEEILEKIWRPDPFFANAKEAEFHEVTFLNFLMRIFPDGLVLYETRIKIKPSCNLILCKYPHDKQTCDLLIKSFAYPVETVRFEWFTRRVDAIDKNPDVKLPELYIDRYEPTVCRKTRKSGAFSCLRAVFRLKRDVGFHIAQTYIPTSLALMFSWVGVWLPEEFMEGRIGVAITVLLTLSTESAGAREHLPSVSYLKAIDLWFGFITGFVFFTLLQTLFVIGFDKRSNQLKKWAMRQKADITEEVREMMLLKAKRYHKTGRYLDNFCRVFYPLSFLLFLIMYYFVFTEGRQDDCINRR